MIQINHIKILVGIILVLFGLLFIVGIWRAIKHSIQGTPSDMPKFLTQIVTVIGGVLATNLGAILGINIDQAQRKGFDAAAFFLASNADVPSKLQIFAAYLYLGSLILALGGWWKLNFTEDPKKVVSTLPQLSQTLLGVAVGVFAVALGR